MKILKATVAAAFVLGPSLALAATPGYLDGFYVADSKLKVHVPGFGSDDDSGDGFGLRVAAPITDQLFVAGEYQTANLDDTDIDVDQIRAGLGFMMGEAPLRFGGLAEYVHLKFDYGSGGGSDTPDGYGLHGRVEFAPMPAATLYGQAGYVHVSDDGSADGFEWQIGGAYNFTKMFGAFVDYRSTDLENDDDGKIKLRDVRLGVRWNFGAM